jgi:hypothetical protein
MPSFAWPELSYPSWAPTCATLHRWLQIVGKVRLSLSPHINHFWQATFYVNARGLTTGAIPMPGGDSIFETVFDFIAAQVTISTSLGTDTVIPMRPCTVKDFEHEFLGALAALGIAVKIWPMPVEIPHPVRFDLDVEHASCDLDAIRRWWRILIQTQRVFGDFRSGFVGKCSPIHLFWGSMDLAVTRFSGRRAPARPGADAVTREAYSHEVSSAGFWPGNDDFPEPAFYAYAAPEPEGFKHAAIRPPQAFYSTQFNEYLLRYDDVRLASDPDATLRTFLDSTYLAAADLAHWNRKDLEKGTA